MRNSVMYNKLEASGGYSPEVSHASLEKIEKIVLATDLCDNTKQVLEVVSQFANDLGAKLKVVFAIEEHLDPQAKNDIDSAKENAHRLLQSLRNNSGDFEYEVLVGKPANVFVDLSDKSDLLVLQLGHLFGLRDALFQTESYKVMLNANCPVLVLPENVNLIQTEKLIIFGDANTPNMPIDPIVFGFNSALEYVFFDDYRGLSEGQQNEMFYNHQKQESDYKNKYPNNKVEINAVNAVSIIDAIENFNHSRQYKFLVYQANSMTKSKKAEFKSQLKEILNLIKVPLLII